MVMDLKIKEVADLLNVSENTINRWLNEGKIPAYRINQQVQFSPKEIEDWVITHKLAGGGEPYPFGEIHAHTHPLSERKAFPKGGLKQFSLYRSIHKGKVFHNVPGNTKDEIIRTTMKWMAKDLNLDADVLTELLLEREHLQPTALNHGIGIPHTRDFLLDAHHDIVTVAFPEKPIPYGALDGQPVDTLFFLFACDDKRHLHLLAKIAHLSSQPTTHEFLLRKPSKESLLDYVKQWESGIHKNDTE
jgi:nitrogen PTS system EIIA component